MRNLSKTVDRILKIEPTLNVLLVPIKLKWEKTHRNELYWNKLMSVLNSEIVPGHPKRVQIQSLFASRKRPPKKLHTFEIPKSTESIVGTIPEHLEGRLRRLDHLQVEYAKRATEARMTHNGPMLIDLTKKFEKLDIDQKRLWWEIKEYFNLWDVGTTTSFFIRYKEPLLVLTSEKINGGPGNGLEPINLPNPSGEGYFVKMDSDMLRKFFRSLNIPPTPGFPENE